MQSRFKFGLTLGLFSLIMVGCTPASPPPQVQKTVKIPKPVAEIPAQYSVPLPKLKPVKQKEKTIPYSYVVWLSQGENRQRMQEYEQYLQQYHVSNIVPMFELLRTARSWESCGASEYMVPSRELWSNSISTLKVFHYLQSAKILKDFEVTSVYRDYPTNSCAGGASSSKHLFNAAIDFRLGSEYPTAEEYLEIEHTKQKLCYFWLQHGASFNMGLGVYRSGQIHIDTQGFRTWGADLTRVSSPCYPLIADQIEQTES